MDGETILSIHQNEQRNRMGKKSFSTIRSLSLQRLDLEANQTFLKGYIFVVTMILFSIRRLNH